MRGEARPLSRPTMTAVRQGTLRGLAGDGKGTQSSPPGDDFGQELEEVRGWCVGPGQGHGAHAGVWLGLGCSGGLLAGGSRAVGVGCHPHHRRRAHETAELTRTCEYRRFRDGFARGFNRGAARLGVPRRCAAADGVLSAPPVAHWLCCWFGVVALLVGARGAAFGHAVVRGSGQRQAVHGNPQIQGTCVVPCVHCLRGAWCGACLDWLSLVGPVTTYLTVQTGVGCDVGRPRCRI